MAALLERVGFVQPRHRTTASRAAGYRRVTRQYVAGTHGVGFAAGRAVVGDHLFALIERTLVWAGWPVGEEIVMVAHKPMRSSQ
jgi:hypothetical protein